MRKLHRFLTLSFFLLISVVSFARADDLPPRPENGVLDRAQILSLPILKATERVLHEHQRLTQDTIFIVTEPDAPRDGIGSEALSLLEAWRGDSPNPPNVIVIAVDAKHGRLAIRAGLGLDTVIGGNTDHGREIRQTIFEPEWRSGKPYRAVVLTLMEVLRSLESPLISSGEAVDGFEHAGFSGGWTAAPVTARTSTTWVWVALGFVIFAFALYRTLAVEVHTTGEGWRRIPVSEVLARRLRRKTAPPLVTGGGVSGNY